MGCYPHHTRNEVQPDLSTEFGGASLISNLKTIVSNKAQKPRWAKLCRSRVKLEKKLACKRCNRSFYNFRAISYHYFVVHSDGIRKKEEPTLEQCLVDLEEEFEKIFGDTNG